jgi:adenosylmethionine-8-amino-7-oxononanoate aminotransferase
MVESRTFRTFPNQKVDPNFVRAEGPYLYDESGNAFLDFTAGFTGHSILGGGVKSIAEAMYQQAMRWHHADYKSANTRERELLAELLLADSGCQSLDKVLYSGGSGSEACEMSLLVCHQLHRERGLHSKNWVIGTRQSYHGTTLGALAIGERPNLEIYSQIVPQCRVRIPEFNFFKNSSPNETIDEYSLRAANYLESAILSIGPESVSCFVAETMLGGLVGDVPATELYWTRIREICDRHCVFLVLDEVWCGGGVSGKRHCFSWDNIMPDFVFAGKTLAAGYAPLSVVFTKSEYEDVIAHNSGRLETSCTFQGHSVCVAAALETQRIICEEELIKRAEITGVIFRDSLIRELSGHEFFGDVRGRGVRCSLEYQCEMKHLFGMAVATHLKENHNIITSGKWHRLSFTWPLNIHDDQLSRVAECTIQAFKIVAGKWTSQYINSLKKMEFF